MSESVSGSHAGHELLIRPRRDDDVVPDVSTPWDAWPEEARPGEGPPPEAPSHLQRAVVVLAGTTVGTMSWHVVSYGPTMGSRAWNIGIALAEPYRGTGIGTTAQRTLAEHLLADCHRVEASTDVENLTEQRSLEKAGFVREGILRSAQHRADGRHHDLVVYSLTRGDLTGGAA